MILYSRLDNSTDTQQQQLNLSVLRFTLGIPGLDESYLPRYIGYAFGSLLVLNHFLGSDSSAITAAQLRTEVLGVFLAAFSVMVPYLGKFLKWPACTARLFHQGALLVEERNVPEDAEQAFVISEEISDTLKEDLAWGTYVLLRNTSTILVVFSLEHTICARGYWRIPKDVSKDQLCDWFEKQIQQSGFRNLNEILYFPEVSDSELLEMLPKGTRSLLVQPVLQTETSDSGQKWKKDGFVLVASSSSYAYNNKDRAWIEAVAKKFETFHSVLCAEGRLEAASLPFWVGVRLPTYYPPQTPPGGCILGSCCCCCCCCSLSDFSEIHKSFKAVFKCKLRC